MQRERERAEGARGASRRICSVRVKRRKEEREEDKKKAVREGKTLTLWLWYSGLALNY